MSGIIFMRVNVLEFLRKKQTFNNVKKNIKLHGNYEKFRHRTDYLHICTVNVVHTQITGISCVSLRTL